MCSFINRLKYKITIKHYGRRVCKLKTLKLALNTWSSI
jgi:hypothetical protein